MAKGKKCEISNCNGIVSYKGRICGKHRARKAKFGSFDLPNHIGEPSYLVEKPALPAGIVKVCKKHGNLTVDQTYHSNNRKKYKYYYCKECILGDNLKRKYLTINGMEDYDSLLSSQNGVCGVCKGSNTTTRNGKIKRFSIDHCHKSGKVRGLLCQFCNSLMGYARDDQKILQSAIEYLQYHSLNPVS